MKRPKKKGAVSAGKNKGGFRFRADGTPVVNTRLTRGMTREQFLKGAGMAGAGVAAAGLGLGKVAKAQAPAGAIVVNASMTHTQIQNAIDGKDPDTGVPKLDWSGVVYFEAGVYNFTEGKEPTDPPPYDTGDAPLYITKAVTLTGPEPVPCAIDHQNDPPHHPTGRDWSGGAVLRGVGVSYHIPEVPKDSDYYGHYYRPTIFVKCTGDHADDEVKIENLFFDCGDHYYDQAFQSTHYNILHSGGLGVWRRDQAYDVPPENWIEGGNLEIRNCRLVGGNGFHNYGASKLGPVKDAFIGCEVDSTTPGTADVAAAALIFPFNKYGSVELHNNYIRQFNGESAGYGGSSGTPIHIADIDNEECQVDITDNTIESYGFCMDGSGSSYFGVFNAMLNFSGNTLRSGTGGIEWESTNEYAGTIRDNTIEITPSEQIPPPRGDYALFGINTSTSNGMNITDNTITGEAYYGIKVDGERCNISNNNLTGFVPKTVNPEYQTLCTPDNLGQGWSEPLMQLDPSGKYGNALYFGGDAARDEITVLDSPSLKFSSTGEITVAAWVYRTEDKWATVVSKTTSDSAEENTFLIFQANSDEDPDCEFYLWFAGFTDYTGILCPKNTWTHVAFTCMYNETEEIYYVTTYENGFKVGEIPAEGNDAINISRLDGLVADWIIGMNIYWDGEYWNGKIDEVRIYNVALNETEIQTVRDNTGPDPAGVGGEVAYYSCDHPNDFGVVDNLQYLYDQSGNNNHGYTNYNSCPWVWEPPYMSGWFVDLDSGRDNIIKTNQFGLMPDAEDVKKTEPYAAIRCEANTSVFVGNNLAHVGEAATYYFGTQSFENMVRGYSGGDVIDAEGYDPTSEVVFFDVFTNAYVYARYGFGYVSDWTDMGTFAEPYTFEYLDLDFYQFPQVVIDYDDDPWFAVPKTDPMTTLTVTMPDPNCPYVLWLDNIGLYGYTNEFWVDYFMENHGWDAATVWYLFCDPRPNPMPIPCPFYDEVGWPTGSSMEPPNPECPPTLTTFTFPTPLMYVTSDGQTDRWVYWGGSLVINPVFIPKNNFITGYERMAGASPPGPRISEMNQATVNLGAIKAKARNLLRKQKGLPELPARPPKPPKIKPQQQ